MAFGGTILALRFCFRVSFNFGSGNGKWEEGSKEREGVCSRWGWEAVYAMSRRG